MKLKKTQTLNENDLNVNLISGTNKNTHEVELETNTTLSSPLKINKT